MSNPEKMKVDDVVEEEKEDTDDQWSTDEESDMKEVVLALPALRIHTPPLLRINSLYPSRSNALTALQINSERVEVSSTIAEEEERLNEQAVVAAQLVMAAAEEAVMKERSDGKKIKKAKKMKKLEDIPSFSGGCSHGIVERKKSKNRELTNPPEGPPACKICGKGFGSWKAVFGHMRLHKDRNYQGFLPPPTFSSVAETSSIPGPNSAFVRVTGGVDGGGGSSSRGGGVRVFGFDLNVDPVVEEEEEEEEVDEAEDVGMFDLNKSPPKDE